MSKMMKFESGFSQEEAFAEASRCLQCKKPLCRQGCPVNNAIPQFIRALKEGEYAQGLEAIYRHSYLPAVCGRVCPQEKQCEASCILARKGQAIRIGKLEQFIADNATDVEFPKVTATMGAIAVIGSGPAGLAAAVQLAQLGYSVTIFEGEAEPGGVLVHGIPEYRLPKNVVRRDIEKIKNLGVEFKLNSLVGVDLFLDDLLAQGYQAVFIGTGAGLPKTLEIPGEHLEGVISALYVLQTTNLYKLGQLPENELPVDKGEKVVVIGAGNVAMDAARTSSRLGAEVTVLARRGLNDMAARDIERDEAIADGVKIRTYAAPLEILGDENVTGIKYANTIVSEDGKVVIKEEESFILPADKIIFAIGQRPYARIVTTSQGFEINKQGLLICDEHGMTTRDGVFAAGDVVHGPATVVKAMGEGRRIAIEMHAYLLRKKLQSAK
ncbi:NADPH-dependent glutamate synthase beta chain-like oxidoreductase [Desulfitobacterium dehalogenans ATCC 51507]|uniref:NADPH-dependent glutamate synthase beta chain-like oxidoreductase n=1 Tax=Desulfitobacterium dehalogenans (strain ATCC 51507 / DSM 9161 / JW/IU-DC1) TaxID=756499 RepID=I4AE02_DESDJ|nr:NAD(P)-dependent oxidoreductase [Desulfitobacterium dehalogenans]AFM02187.1 NADPH-dependent glutamate synthase beta chain-like oxidoreductase [Desulfitobacterium dehalogenans ATCC 51507]